MSLKKRLLCLAAAVLMLVGTLAACSSTSSETGSNTANHNTGSDNRQQEVTLRFSWWGGDSRHQATLQAIEAYKKVAPHVTIEAEYQGFDGYEQKIKTQLASSTAPDIIQLDYPWLPELSKGDYFLDLRDQSDFNLDAFDEDFLNNFGVFNDKLIALPTGVNAYAIIVNKTLADELGIHVDQQLDWDTLYELGKQLHERDPSKYLMFADHNGLIHDFTRIVKQRTGKSWIQDDYTLGFGREDAIAGFEWIKKIYEDGVYQPLGEAELYFGNSEQNPKWINKEIVMVSGMGSTVSALKSVFTDDTEITTILHPKDPNEVNSAIIVRPSQMIAVNAKTKHPEETVKFLNWFMNDPEAAAILGDVRSVPASSIAQQAAVEAGKIDPVVAKSTEEGLAHQGLPDSQLSNDSKLQQTLQDVIEKVAFGQATPEQAADELMNNLEKLLVNLKD